MSIIISIIFIIGYAAIAFEHPIKINKAATAVLTAVLCWSAYALLSPEDSHHIVEQLGEHLGETAAILFFLLGAMTIVELIDAHDGFQIIVEKIRTTDKRKFIWLVAFITFFLSAVLDNLTTAIVMVSLLSKMVADREERWMLAGLVIIAANAGGAWSPIGDVTTTMLWIGGQLTTANMILHLILPSLACLLVPTFFLTTKMKGKMSPAPESATRNLNFTADARERNIVFGLGLGSLLFVPIFKTITHLPPYMGILFGLGLLWVVTELIHSQKDEEEKGLLSVNHALRKIDTPSVLFFLGILLAVAALQSVGVLSAAAAWLDRSIGNITLITVCIGLLSAVVDNVPLVAAAMGMYDMAQFPTDHYFWKFLAYCAGTGGSCLIIGSAAGVAAMGLEKIDFIWYLKRIAFLALIGYLAGAGVYVLQSYFF